MKGEILESVMNVKGAKCGREEKKALMAARYKYSLSLSKWFCRKTKNIITAIRFSSVSFLFLLFISPHSQTHNTIILLKDPLFFPFGSSKFVTFFSPVFFSLSGLCDGPELASLLEKELEEQRVFLLFLCLLDI